MALERNHLATYSQVSLSLMLFFDLQTKRALILYITAVSYSLLNITK